MKLVDVVRQLQKWDAESTIYARPPWSPATEAQLAVQGSDDEKRANAQGLRYFMEVSIARDFLDDWRTTQELRPSDTQACERLIEYATNDA